MSTAVLVYSLSGNTKRVADAVAARLGATVAVLQAPRVRPGPLSVLRLGFAALTGRATPVEVQGPDPLRAGLLVLASPVWAGRLSVPMRPWLATRPPLPARVALIMTGAAPKPADTSFADFAARTGVQPAATLYVSAADVAARRFDAAAEAFCRGLAQVGARPGSGGVEPRPTAPSTDRRWRSG